MKIVLETIENEELKRFAVDFIFETGKQEDFKKFVLGKIEAKLAKNIDSIKQIYNQS